MTTPIIKERAETLQNQRSSFENSGDGSLLRPNLLLVTVPNRDDSQITNPSLDFVKDEKVTEKCTIDANNREPSFDPSSPNFKRPFSNTRWFLVCLGLYLSAFLYGMCQLATVKKGTNHISIGLDTTIAADVQGPILVSLGEIEKLPWIGIGFPMGSVSVILLIGICNGLFNIKYLIIAGIATFEIGSAVCGATPNMNGMICGRVIAGIGGAEIYIG
jgi:hypothetical protein